MSYNPTLGRWMQQDPNPAGQYADGMNLYQMEGSNPVRFCDPFGFGVPTEFDKFMGWHGGVVFLDPSCKGWNILILPEADNAQWNLWPETGVVHTQVDAVAINTGSGYTYIKVPNNEQLDIKCYCDSVDIIGNPRGFPMPGWSDVTDKVGNPWPPPVPIFGPSGWAY
jgi:hypothetical protein